MIKPTRYWSVPWAPVNLFWTTAILALLVSQLMRWLMTGQIVMNPALAFSIAAPQAAIYALTIFFIGLMIWLFYQYRSIAPLWALGLGLIVGGGVSNLLDRLLLSGSVADYWSLFSISTINLPDIFITLGILLAIRQQILLWYRQK